MRQLLGEWSAVRQAVADLGDRLAAARAAEEHAAAAVAPAQAAAATAQRRLERAAAAHDAARLRGRLAERREALSELSGRLERAAAAQRRREAAAARLAALAPVDDAALAELDRLQREAQRLEAALAAASPHVELTALGGLRLTVEGGVEDGVEGGAGHGDESARDDGRVRGEPRDGGNGDGGGHDGGGEAAGESGGGGSGEAERVELAAGQTWRRRAASPLRLTLAELATLSIVPGGDAAELGRRLARVREESAGRCRRLGVETIEAARELHRERRDAEGERRAAQAVLDGLGAGADPEALTRRHAALAAELERLEGELGAAAAQEAANAETAAQTIAGAEGPGAEMGDNGREAVGSRPLASGTGEAPGGGLAPGDEAAADGGSTPRRRSLGAGAVARAWTPWSSGRRPPSPPRAATPTRRGAGWTSGGGPSTRRTPRCAS